jgi:hypothetical protein
LSWSRFITLLPLKSDYTFMFYAQGAAALGLGKHDLRRQISGKAYERRDIADSQPTVYSSSFDYSNVIAVTGLDVLLMVTLTSQKEEARGDCGLAAPLETENKPLAPTVDGYGLLCPIRLNLLWIKRKMTDR